MKNKQEYLISRVREVLHRKLADIRKQDRKEYEEFTKFFVVTCAQATPVFDNDKFKEFAAENPNKNINDVPFGSFVEINTEKRTWTGKVPSGFNADGGRDYGENPGILIPIPDILISGAQYQAVLHFHEHAGRVEDLLESTVKNLDGIILEGRGQGHKLLDKINNF